MDENTTSSEKLEVVETETEAAEPAVEEEQTEPTEEATPEGAPEADAEPTVDDEPGEPVDGEQAPEESMSRDEFIAIADEFGDDIAARAMREGGGVDAARKMYTDALKQENEQLREKVAELEAASGNGKPAKVVRKKGEAASLFKTGK